MRGPSLNHYERANPRNPTKVFLQIAKLAGIPKEEALKALEGMK